MIFTTKGQGRELKTEKVSSGVACSAHGYLLLESPYSYSCLKVGLGSMFVPCDISFLYSIGCHETQFYLSLSRREPRDPVANQPVVGSAVYHG